MKGKKNSLNACHDLKEIGIKKDLHQIMEDRKWSYPVACYTLPKDEKHKVCKFLKSIKLPNGYSSKIWYVILKDGKIFWA